jgi:RNA polymerase sigma-70 factor (ECF subfamily)
MPAKRSPSPTSCGTMMGVMDAESRTRLEGSIRALCDAGQHGEAATVAIKGYGPEILGYLVATARTETDATDAFSMFCEDVWRGLPRFRFASSLRTWAYTLARHALYRLVRDPERRRPKVSPSEAPELAELAENIRTSTMLHLRTEVKDRVAALREQLDEEDRTILILRVDRKLAWQDIARVLAVEDITEADANKRSAALRKRFERIKDRLRKLAAEVRSAD